MTYALTHPDKVQIFPNELDAFDTARIANATTSSSFEEYSPLYTEKGKGWIIALRVRGNLVGYLETDYA